MAAATETPVAWPICSMLLFVATSSEEDELRRAAKDLGVAYRKDAAVNKLLRAGGLGEDFWVCDPIGAETVGIVGCSREDGRVVMGAHGRLGSAAKAVRYLTATGAQGVVQVGIAFGVAPTVQRLGDVLVSTRLIPYDSRDVVPATAPPGYTSDYQHTRTEPARPALVDRCRRERALGRHEFGVHIGPMLSGSARIHCATFRDELLAQVPRGDEPVVGGEMEGVGLLAASLRADDPVWCVVKGISDFADENRDRDVKEGRTKAAYNAAFFVLSGLRSAADGNGGRS